MKKPMNLLTFVLSGIFAIALWSDVNSQSARAAEVRTSIAPYEIKMDYENQQLILTETGRSKDVEIFCEYGVRKTVTTGRGSSKYSRDVCSFYDTSVFDYKDGLVIDLSTLNREKDCYIRLYGDYYSDPVTVKIPAVNTAIKAEYDAIEGIVDLYDYTDKSNITMITSEQIEYRTTYGNWKDYYYDDLSVYQYQGATLYFRLRAKASEQLSLTAPEPVSGDIEDVAGEDIPVYEAYCFPGKEIKVTVAKQASAPKVVVNYSKQTFTLPKGTEYRVISQNSMNWIAAKKNTSLSVSLTSLIAQYGENDGMTFEVRQAETEKKPASKINRISFTIPSAPSVDSIEKVALGTGISGQNITANCLYDEYGSEGLVAEYVYDAKKKRYTGVRFTNCMTDAYEIYAASAGEVPSPANTGYQTIKARPELSSQDAVTTLSITKLKEGSRLYIRKKCNSAEKQFCSPYTVFGVVSYPDEAPEG